ncbi:MAG: hypothetical protein ACFB13_13320 [Kiloniellaceae bacterium]
MSFKLTRFISAAAIAAAAILVASAPADAKDWRRSVDRHYSAAEETKYVPRGDNPQWDFNLETVVADMAWRARTAAMLRNLPKPSAEPDDAEPANQLADDSPEQPAFRFAF